MTEELDIKPRLSGYRRAMATAALTVPGIVWLALDARGGFVGHMALHLSIVAAAAPLLALALAGHATDPVRRAPWLFAPVPATLIEFAVVWGWHLPALHGASHRSPWLFGLEQASYLAVGLLVWLAAMGGARAEWRPRAAAGIAALLLTSMHMTLLGVLLATAPRSLYGNDGALSAQQAGGVLMLGVGGSVYLLGALALLARLLREEHAGA